MPGGFRRRPAPVAALLAVGTAGLLAALWFLTPSRFPSGFDPGLWGLEAVNHLHGFQVSLAPLYPVLVGEGMRLGLGTAQAGAWVAAGSFVAVPPLIARLAARLGAPPLLAALAGAAVLCCPLVALTGLQFQPDATSMVVFLLAALAAVGFLERPGPVRLAGVVLTAALCPLAREHGILAAPLLAVVAGMAPGRAPVRALRVLAVGGGVLAGPLLVGELGSVPLWRAPFLERITLALSDAGASSVPRFAKELSASDVATLMSGSSVARHLLYARLDLAADPPAWAWLLLSIALVPRLAGRGRWGVLAILLPALSAILIYSKARHVGVALPVASAVLAASLARERGRARLAVGVAGAVLVLASLLQWPAAWREHEVLSGRLQEIARFGKALCDRTEPGDVAAGEGEAFLFCPLPVHVVAPESVFKGKISPADWKAWYIVPGHRAEVARVSPPWTLVPLGEEFLHAVRIRPDLEGDARPCAGSVPAPDTPYRLESPRPVTLVPPCTPPDGLLPARFKGPAPASGRFAPPEP